MYLHLALEHVPDEGVPLLFGAECHALALPVALPVDAALPGMLEVEVRSVQLLRPLVLPLGGVRLLEPKSVVHAAHHHWREGCLQSRLRLFRSAIVAVSVHRGHFLSRSRPSSLPRVDSLFLLCHEIGVQLADEVLGDEAVEHVFVAFGGIGLAPPIELRSDVDLVLGFRLLEVHALLK